MWSRKGAALGGALIAPLALGLLVALPFLASLILPRGEGPHATTEMLVKNWNWPKWAGGAVWGVALAWITGVSAIRMGVAGLIGMVAGDSIVFGPLSAVLAPLFVDRPSHIEMAVTLPLAVATIAAAMGLLFAIAAGQRQRLALLSLASPAAAALAIVLTIAALDASGVRTGTGDLAMSKVFVLGSVVASAVVGAMQAWALSPQVH